MTKILLPEVTQCKQKYMADKTQRKIRKFRFLFQVHLWRYVTGFSLPSSKIDPRKNISPISSLLTHPALRVPAYSNHYWSKLLSYYLSTQLKPSAVASRAQQFFFRILQKYSLIRNLWVDTLDRYFSGPVKSVKTSQHLVKKYWREKRFGLFFYTILAFHIV